MNETKQNQDSPVAELEVIPPSAIEAIERAQVDLQIATAHRFPRSLEKFKKRAIDMATLDEETAESCIYTRPVGKELNKATGKWEEKYAEGASIRLAEIVAASYGNIRVSSRIIEQTDRYVKCEGMAHDLESNYAGKSEVVEATVKIDGKPYSERQRAVLAKVALAKAYRDAVFKVVPKALSKSVYEAAKAVCSGKGKSLEQRQQRVRAWLTSIKVDDARVFAALSVNGWSEIGDEKLLTLTGLKTAISDGDVTVEEAFPPLPKTPKTDGPPVDPDAAKQAAGSIDDQGKVLEKPYEAIEELCKRDGITVEQVFEYARQKQLTNADQVELIQLSDDKLRKIVKAWPSWAPIIKKAS